MCLLVCMCCPHTPTRLPPLIKTDVTAQQKYKSATSWSKSMIYGWAAFRSPAPAIACHLWLRQSTAFIYFWPITPKCWTQFQVPVVIRLKSKLSQNKKLPRMTDSWVLPTSMGISDCSQPLHYIDAHHYCWQASNCWPRGRFGWYLEQHIWKQQ